MPTLRFTGKDIDGQAAVCTVEQILLLLKACTYQTARGHLTWFVAAIEAYDPALAKFEAPVAVKAGSTADLVALLQQVAVPQIIFGLFLAVLDERNAPGPRDMFDVEGPSGRRYSLSELELLAVDTTYIEITSDRPDIIAELRSRFPTSELIVS